MSESSHPGIAYLFQLYTHEQERTEQALQKQACHSSLQEREGMEGIPVPYQLRSDGMVTGILFLCFMLVSYVLAHGKKYLRQKGKSFVSSRQRASLFDDTTASDVRYTLALIFQTCILFGFCVYDYFSDRASLLFDAVPHSILLGTYIASMVLFFTLKWLLYGFVNWIFFNKGKNVVWMESYFGVIAGAGILLFPIVLLIIYFDLPSEIAPYFILFIIIIAKIPLFYKCFSNFFNTIYGSFHLILYFCALEILPDFILWKGISIANNILFLNF